MKKRLLSVLLVAVLTLSLAACGSKGDSSGDKEAKSKTEKTDEKETKTKGIKLGISNGYYGNTWRAQYVKSMEELCEQYKSDGTLSDYQIVNSTGDVTEELNNINGLISSGVDILMISPNSPTSMGSVIQSAIDQGIMVIIFNDAAAYEGTYCIYNDQSAFWEIQAKWFAEKLGGKGNIVQITGSSGNSTSELRISCAAKVFEEYPDIKILASAPGEWSETTAQSVMSTFLSTYGEEIDGAMAEDVMANGLARAYENAGIEPKIMSGDTQKSFIDWNLKHPDVATIASPSVPAIGVNSINMALKLYMGEELKDDVLQPNQEDESLVNAIVIPMPFVIVSQEEDKEGPWTEGHDETKFITTKEAAEMCEGKEDSYMLDMSMSEEQLNSYFK